jgi:hypothetical protein
MNRSVCLVLLLFAAPVAAQQPPAPLTAEQDHQNMMDQLGIRRLRPGPSGNESAPNRANYDTSLATPFATLPDPLTLNDGRKVTTPALWWDRRRAEIVEGFEREVYGRVPATVPAVTWRVLVSEREFVGFMPVTTTRLIGHVDNSAYPAITVDIAMTVVVPATARGPVPVLMMFGRSVLPAPAQPPQEDVDSIDAALKRLLVRSDPSLAAIFGRYPAYELVARAAPAFPFGAAAGPGGQTSEPPATVQLLRDGWGYAFIDPNSIQADNGAGLTRGIIGLVNHGRPRKPDDWGALRAWAWGAARGLDYLETDSLVDARHVGIEGVSRYGKAALVTLAFEPRFALGLIGSSGKGGATLLRRNYGEAVENLTGVGEYHWMAGTFLNYGAAEATFGSRTANDLPVDSHELIALCAPRLVFISYGVPERGDANWLDHRGSWMAAVAAGKVFRLLGAKDLGVGDDWRSTPLPPVLTGLLDGQLAWRQHDGGHTDAPNVQSFIQWADRMIGHTAPRN